MASTPKKGVPKTYDAKAPVDKKSGQVQQGTSKLPAKAPSAKKNPFAGKPK
jgi:hypothetical protein